MKDPNELLPFCTRCFNIGISYGDHGEVNFCHMCGSMGTCVPMTREYVEYLRHNIEYAIQHWYDIGIKIGRKENV